MPFTNGTYTLPANSFNPAQAGSVISTTGWNATAADFASSFSLCWLKDGTQTATANWNLSGYKITNVTVTAGSASRTEFTSGGVVQDGIVSDAGVTGGTSTAYTATLAPAITAYADKALYRVQFDEACGASPTINFNSLGAKKLYKNVGGVATQLAANDALANQIGQLRYDAALDSAAGGFWVLSVSTIQAGTVTPLEMAAATIGIPTNCTIAASVAANALTVALKTYAGTDPSATDPIKIPVVNNTGGWSTLTITSAISIVVSSGSTLGTSNGVIAPLWLVIFDDASTPRLGIVNTFVGTGNIFALSPDEQYSSTAEGGAGGADSAGVIYTGTAVSSKNLCILGRMEVTEATAGTWATAPSKVQIMRPSLPLPGTRGLCLQSAITTPFTTSSTSYTDVTTVTVTTAAKSACSQYEMTVSGIVSATTGVGGFMQFVRNGTAIYVGDAAGSRNQATSGLTNCTDASMGVPFSQSVMDFPASTANTYKLQAKVTSSSMAIGSSVTDANTAIYARFPTVIKVQEIYT